MEFFVVHSVHDIGNNVHCSIGLLRGGIGKAIMKPTIGRIVHYQSYGTPNKEYLPLPRAAVITDVIESTCAGYNLVSLCVLNPTGMFFNVNVPYSEEPKPGHWNWPPRV